MRPTLSRSEQMLASDADGRSIRHSSMQVPWYFRTAVGDEEMVAIGDETPHLVGTTCGAGSARLYEDAEWY